MFSAISDRPASLLILREEKSAGCEAFNPKSCDGASGGENRVEPLPKPGVRVEV